MREQSEIDRHFMRLALEVGRRGAPNPNPHVGAILARGDRLLAWGHHARAGLAHAEVVALSRAGREARGATLYVSLEPCNHQGRTPPCVQAILAAGVSRVVIGTLDPNRGVRGGGAEELVRAGVEVVWSELEVEARELIAPWVDGWSRPHLSS